MTGSVITETIVISTRQRGHSSGSTSKIIRSSRARLFRRWALLVFARGLRRYESGSRFGVRA